MKLRWRELKLRTKRNKRIPHPIPDHRASSKPLSLFLNKEGSAICDRFSEPFSEESFAMLGLNKQNTLLRLDCFFQWKLSSEYINYFSFRWEK
jgi:hypothetical protein